MVDKIVNLLETIDKSEVKMDKVRYTYDGIPVPSVTQILSKCIAEEYLIKWANYLGFKRIKYKDQLGLAATIGTDGHNAVEDYLVNGIECENICYKSFRIWWDALCKNNTVEIIGIERQMLLPYCSGTYDILLKINGKIFLVDLKTSNHVGYKYFIQLAGYRHMLYKTEGINIDGCLILQLDKEIPSFEEFTLDFSIAEHYEFIEHCAFTFVSLVLSYYNTNKAESMFKQIF